MSFDNYRAFLLKFSSLISYILILFLKLLLSLSSPITKVSHHQFLPISKSFDFPTSLAKNSSQSVFDGRIDFNYK